MRRLLTTLFLAACTLSAMVPAARAQSLLFYNVGFDYEFPNPNPSVFGELGSGYVGVGTVLGVFAPLVGNPGVNEYTYVIQGLTPSSVTHIANFDLINYTSGTITLYEDPIAGGTAADYGVAPPNGTAPSTFTDGTAILVGTLTNFVLNLNTTSGTGSFEATFTATGGSQIGNFPLNQRTGWTFSGATNNALNIPQGYAHQCAGQTFLDNPVSTKHVSWGKLKEGYR
jgi:hypothetical protein